MSVIRLTSILLLTIILFIGCGQQTKVIALSVEGMD